MEYKKNLIPGIILAAFSVAYLGCSAMITPFTGPGATPLDNRAVPWLWGGLLLLLSVILIVRGIKERKAYMETAGKKIQSGRNLLEICKENKEVLCSFVFLAIYVALMEPAGFLISTALYVYAETVILTRPEKRNYVIPIIVAIVTAVAIDFVFVRLLNVLLPTGIIGF
ncbi:MAG: tripartite tricarboxylate transporter TctB family protein [Lachnospiraceae bacterium]|nr:tripartite tricarboxylate transporter TctB family protein [Lachnospiraceae bacterium]